MPEEKEKKEKEAAKIAEAENDAGKIKVTPYMQKEGFGLCGPAALKILLSYFGKNYSEEQISQLAESVAGLGRGEGTEHEGMIQAIKEIGGFVFAKENGTMEELEYFIKEEKLPVVVGWFSTYGIPDDHYSVVVNVTDKNIIMVDPEAEAEKPERWVDKNVFPKIWFDFIGKDDRVISWGWYMVVSFEKKKFPKIKGGYYY